MTSARWTPGEYELYQIRMKEREKLRENATRQPATITPAELKREKDRAEYERHMALERDAGIELASQLAPFGIPSPDSHLERVIPGRKFQFDLGYPARKILIEIDGGTRAQGRHTRHAGFESDMVKTNEAAILGWTVLRFTYPMIHDGRAADQVRRCYER